jgi:hypothetical protein
MKTFLEDCLEFLEFLVVEIEKSAIKCLDYEEIPSLLIIIALLKIYFYLLGSIRKDSFIIFYFIFMGSSSFPSIIIADAKMPLFLHLSGFEIIISS